MLPLSQDFDYDREAFNRATEKELETVRDFVLLHYKQTRRDDTDFWRYCRSMDIPDSLASRIHIYRDSGRIHWQADELFTVNSWNQVLLGQGVEPQHYHPAADNIPAEQFAMQMKQLREGVRSMIDKLPSHEDFLKLYCQGRT